MIANSRSFISGWFYALALHELTTQIPHVIDLAIDIHARRPAVAYPPVHRVFAGHSGPASYSQAVTHASFLLGNNSKITTAAADPQVAGRTVRIYSPARGVRRGYFTASLESSACSMTSSSYSPGGTSI